MPDAPDLERSRLVDIEVVMQWLSLRSVNAVKRRVKAVNFLNRFASAAAACAGVWVTCSIGPKR